MINGVSDKQYAPLLYRSGQSTGTESGGFSDALLSYGGGSSFTLEDENTVSYDTTPEEAEARAEAKSLIEEFSEWAHMDVAELIRAQYLQDQGLTEESLAAMDPDARKAIEEDIAELIKERLGVDKGATSAGSTEASEAAVEA